MGAVAGRVTARGLARHPKRPAAGSYGLHASAPVPVGVAALPAGGFCLRGYLNSRLSALVWLS
jgi:hypothetical protein